MKQQLITISAVVLVGCGTTQPTEPPTAKAPDISIHKAADDGNIEAIKQHITYYNCVKFIEKRERQWNLHCL